jgi:hypothetical protein
MILRTIAFLIPEDLGFPETDHFLEPLQSEAARLKGIITRWRTYRHQGDHIADG